MLKYLLLILTLISCSTTQEKKVTIPKYPDPEHASMRGKVKSHVTWDSSLSIYDSLIYDDEGRLIRRKDNGIWGTINLTQYDSNNFPTRTYHHSDMVANLLYSYSQNDDTLLQSVFQSELRDFINDDTTFNFKKPYQANYYLIKNGLFSEFVSSSGWKILYLYDSLNRVIKVETKQNQFNSNIHYYYEGTGLNLKSEILIQESDTIQIKNTRTESIIL